MRGIYAYWDNKLSQYVYIGKDSYIDKNERHKDHLNPSKYDLQPFNRILQNNPERYEYQIIMKGDYSEKQLNKMEIFCIKHFKTYYYDYPERHVFNFTKGGDGSTGYKHTDEAKQKMSKVHKGKKISEKQKEQISNFHKGKKLSKETKLKISKAKIGHDVSNETRNKISKIHKGKTLSDEHKKIISERTKGENNPRYRYDIPRNDELLKEYLTTDTSHRELADKYNCSISTITRRLKKARENK